ncbi:MAG TPA: AAA family ATPase, partial [Bacteroidales bacterium]|nr:AAA family ATPase [Bacteroidales bacterium]
SMPVKGSPEEEFVSGIRRILSDFDEKEILLNNKLVKRIAAIPFNQLNESHLRAVVKSDFPELYDCLLLLNNPDQFSKVSDLLRQKRYADWENDFIDDEITTSQRTSSVSAKKKLSEAIEQHIQILFGESAMFMSLTDLAVSREGFNQVFNDYRNLRSFISFCELFLDKLIYDLETDLGKSLPLSVNHYNRGMNITFDSPLHSMVRNHSQSRRKNGFMKKWMTRFHLCDDLFFETPIKGMGYFPGVKKNHESTPLSEEGAGSNHLMMMLLEISGSAERYDLHDFNDEPRNYPRTIMIEEPETRLHPAWQSRLADMFIDARKETGCDLLIDTCSEYLIRKLQYLVEAGELDKNDIVIYYLDANRCKGGETTIREITVGDDGELSQPFGSGFLFEDEIEMMKLKKVNRN